MRVGLIGTGLIGTEVRRQCLEKGWTVAFSVDIYGTYDSEMKPIDSYEDIPVSLVFLAIPSSGDAAFAYIKQFRTRGIPVVTCEKAALGYNFEKLEEDLEKIGYSATVGGGSRIIPFAKKYAKDISKIKIVLNGSINFLCSEVSKGVPINDALKQAMENGYVEPGSDTFHDALSGELNDVQLKSAIIFNLLAAAGMSSARIKPSDLTIDSLSEKDFDGRRYVVTMSKEDGGWRIKGSMENIPSDSELFGEGVHNAIEVTLSDGSIYSKSGLGAGPEPTVDAMMQDAVDLTSS